MKESSELDPREAAALRALRGDATPPPGLEDRVVHALSRQDLIGRRRSARVLVLAAAAAGIFLAGLAVGEWRHGTSDVVEGGRYVLLLREGPSYQAASTPEGERERVAEYAGWAGELAQSGRFVDGEKLAESERVVALPGIGETDQEASITGYFIIESDSYEEAARIARSSPHVRHGGTVEVRRIEDTD